ncbi:DNA alkylation repair protein [Vibrio sp.]|uniref:DNA alkylation repair protein n=1 Tax=Vibrio sp. TaxID=678 RepID=UPI003D0CDA6B
MTYNQANQSVLAIRLLFLSREQSMHPWNQAVQTALEPLADAKNARMMKSYLCDQFEFYDIQSGPRRDALKLLFSTAKLPA